MRQYCKHRSDLLAGDVTSLASTNLQDLHQLRAIFIGSDLEEAAERVRVAEAAAAAAELAVRHAKQDMAWIMNRTNLTLLVDIPGTGYKKGQRGRLAKVQENGPQASDQGTDLAKVALLVEFPRGGEIWLKPSEVERD